MNPKPNKRPTQRPKTRTNSRTNKALFSRRNKTRRSSRSPLHHSRGGYVSCVLAGISFVGIVLSVIYAAVVYGETMGLLGGIILLCGVFAIVGISYGLKGLGETEYRQLNAKIGLVSNLFVLFLVVLFYISD